MTWQTGEEASAQYLLIKKLLVPWLYFLAYLYFLLGDCYGNRMEFELLRLACKVLGDLVAELQRVCGGRPVANTQAFQVT